MTKPLFYFTDVFTQSRYGGNQLATFYQCDHLTDLEMQQIAREINFSETTFIAAAKNNADAYDVRIFTPTAEVEFAGHPTIGTAHVLRNKILQTQSEQITLNLKAGRIPVRFSRTESGVDEIWMQQLSPVFGKQLDVKQIAEVLSLDVDAFATTSPIEEVSTGFPHIVVPLKSMAHLQRAKIDLSRYHALVEHAWAKLILVFCPDAYETHQQLGVRVFAPYYGVMEDAATGSGNGCLAAYLLRHRSFGEAEINLRTGQGYELGRPSTLALRARQTQESIDVFVGGTVVDVAEGTWG